MAWGRVQIRIITSVRWIKLAVQPRLLSTFFSFFLISSWAVANSSTPNLDSGFVPGELLVKFKSDVHVRGKANARDAKHVFLKTEFPSLGVEHWVLPADVNLSDTLAQLRADPTVDFAEPNYRRYPRRVPNESTSSLGNVLARLEQMNVPAAWDAVIDASNVTVAMASKVIVAVIDDGFDMTHPDLKNNYYLPRDVMNDDDDPSFETVVLDPKTNEKCVDDHGTEVAGVLAAQGDNSIGISGVVWKVKLMPIRVGCEYSVSHIIKALQYAKAKGAHIVNVSWGGPQFSAFESAAISDLLESNMLVVAAAGNFDVDNDKVPDFPSGLPWPNIISVAAIDVDNRLAKWAGNQGWTQYGATTVDVAAPGVDIWTTKINKAYTDSVGLLEGTSFSAPYVAGIAALIKAKYPAATFRDLKGAIMSSVTPLKAQVGGSATSATGRLATDGFVNAKAALDAMTKKVPVLVINKVVVDDALGNKNGVADPGEEVDLKITIENVWIPASNVSLSLGVDVAAPSSVNDMTILTSPSIKTQIGSGEMITETFKVKVASQLAGRKVIPLTLKLGVGQLMQERHYRLELGELKKGVLVRAVSRPSNDLLDEFHYFHVDVPANSKDLVFELVPDALKNLDLLVRYNSPPEFDYTSYKKETKDDVAVGTLVQSSPAGTPEKITISSPKAGTYFATVVAPREENKDNLGYSISANYGRKAASAPSGGCSLTQQGSVDLMLPLLVLTALWRVIKSRNRNLNRA